MIATTGKQTDQQSDRVWQQTYTQAGRQRERSTGRTTDVGKQTDLGFVARDAVVDVPDDLDQLAALLLQADQEAQQVLTAAKPSVTV